MPFSRHRHLGFLSACVAAAVSLAAADQQPARSIPILRPGSPELDLAHIRTRDDTTPATPPDSAHPRGLPARRAAEILTDDPRGPAVTIIQQVTGYADSAIVLRSTLRPIREFQNYITRHRRLVYEYDGNRVHVRDSTADSAVRIRDHAYEGDFFVFNELALVIRSLPLRAGYEAILPLYSEGSDTIEMDTVQVLGKDGAGAWSVRFADPVVIVLHTIDGTSRRIVSSKGTQRSTGRSGPSLVVR